MIKILMVEDDPIQLDYYSEVLSDDFHVLTATTVAEAIVQLDSEQVNAVGCDYHLNDGTGQDMVNWIAAHAPRLLHKTVLISGEEAPQINGYKVQCLQKPVAIDTLLETFSAWFSVSDGDQHHVTHAA